MHSVYAGQVSIILSEFTLRACQAVNLTFSVGISDGNIAAIWEQVCCHGDTECLVRHLIG